MHGLYYTQDIGIPLARITLVIERMKQDSINHQPSWPTPIIHLQEISQGSGIWIDRLFRLGYQ